MRRPSGRSSPRSRSSIGGGSCGATYSSDSRAADGAKLKTTRASASPRGRTARPTINGPKRKGTTKARRRTSLALCPLLLGVGAVGTVGAVVIVVIIVVVVVLEIRQRLLGRQRAAFLL